MAAETNPVVDKIDAAARELETAIWLWFNHSDIVSVHTLVDAAFGIILDLFHARKWPPPIPFDDPAGAESRKLRNKLREAGTYGKHARKDHDLAYEYSETFIEGYLAAAVSALSRLRQLRKGGVLILFWIWFGSRNPTLVQTVPISTERLDVERIARMARAEFFLEFGGDFVGNPPRPDAQWREAGSHLP